MTNTNVLAKPVPELLPLHAQITNALRHQILAGDYQALQRLPSESALSLQFGASRITVRQALAALENERLIFRQQGKGSFVAKTRPRPVQQLTRLQGFGEAMAELGLDTRNELRGFIEVPADALVAERLGLEMGAPVTAIQRVRRVDGAVVSLDVTWLPAELGRRLQGADLLSRDVFLIIENDLGVDLGHADLRIDAVGADTFVAEALGLSTGAPVLRIERLTHTVAGRPIDFEYLYYPGDAFQCQLRVERATD